MKRKKKNPGILILLIFLAVIFAFPIYLIVINSFKTYGDIFSKPLAFPWHPILDNYKNAWARTDFIRYFINTVISTVLALVLAISFSSLAAFKLSRTKTKLSVALYAFFTMSMLMPFEVIMLPLVVQLKHMKMLNSLPALSVVQASMSLAFDIFLFHGFIKSIPPQLDEAARIDGCGEFRLFFQIIFPVLKPIVTSVAVLNVLTFWNSFTIPLLLLTKEEVKTLPLFAYSFLGQYSSNYDMQLPAVIMTGLPLVIFYILMQKNIVKGLAASGSVKG